MNALQQQLAEASSLLAAQRYEESSRLFFEVLTVIPKHFGALAGLGIGQFKLGKFELASSTLALAHRLMPQVHLVAIYEARAFAARGLVPQAVAKFEQVSEPENLAIEDANEYAQLAMAIGKPERGEIALIAALKRQEDDPLLWTTLAQLYERTNRLSEAETALSRCSTLDSYGLLLRGKLASRQGRYGEALVALEAAESSFSEHQRESGLFAELQFERGKVLDALSDYDAAMDAYAAGNQTEKTVFLASGSAEIAFAGLFEDEELDRQVLSRRKNLAERQPVFLVGFPRSGTTLLEKMLDAHPNIISLEEQPMVDTILSEALDGSIDAPQSIKALSESKLDELRARYWTLVAERIEVAPGLTFIDKNPLNLVNAHFLSLVFPQARWIFAVRHPCDCVLSCFMQRFAYTPISQGFWDLEKTAVRYRQVIGRWLRQRDALKLDYHDIRYEDLILDPPVHLAALFKFLQLEPVESSTYSAPRGGNWIATPSYGQVSQPLYTTAVNRWLRYRDRMTGIARQLSPLIEALGYPPPDESSTPD